MRGAIHFVPSPIDFQYDILYQAMVNRSGRMQYYRTPRGKNRERISRTEFIHAYNHKEITALTPIQARRGTPSFQIEFYTNA